MVYDSTVPALAVRITESGHKVSYWPLVSPVAGTKPAAISEMLVGRRLSRSLRRVKRRTWLSKRRRPQRGAEAPAGCQGGGEAGGTAREVDQLQCLDQADTELGLLTDQELDVAEAYLLILKRLGHRRTAELNGSHPWNNESR